MPKKFAIALLATLLFSGCGTSEKATEQAYDFQAQTTLASEQTRCTDPSVFREAGKDLSECQMESAAKSDDFNPKDQAGKSAPSYFGFQRTARTEYREDGIALMSENLCRLDFHTADSEAQEWVDELLAQYRQTYDSKSQNLIKYAEEMIAENGTDSFYTYSNYQDQAILRHDERFVSVVTVSHVYSGGPHPNSVQTAANLDLQERRLLRLEDIILEDGVDRLEQTIQDTVDERFAPLGINALYEEYPEIISKSMNYGEMTPYWYFSRDGLAIFYNQYELGPYAAGIITVDIPYERLRGILRDEFYPQAFSGPEGNLKILDDAGSLERISLEIVPGGSELLIGAVGTVREVRVSEVFWVDRTPVTQSMLISLNALDEGQVLVLNGGFDDQTRSFAVEFRTDNRTMQTYFIHDGALVENPEAPDK